MKRWEKVRRALKALGGAAIAVGGSAAVAGKPWHALGCAIVGYLLPLAADVIPRDPWTPEELEAHRAKRRRTTTRPNPITGGE